jgi:hypothetical protein
MVVLVCGPLSGLALYRFLFFPTHFILIVISVLLYFVPSAHLLMVSARCLLFNPGAPENAVAVVEDGALAGSYGALRRIENNSRADIV